MYKLSLMFISLILMGMNADLKAENPADKKTVVIQLTDNSQQPVAGVTAFVKSSGTGAVSDGNGRLEIKVADDDTIELSCLGYVSQRVTSAGRSRIDVILEEDSFMIDETVVIGYGSVKKADLTGAVSAVKGDRIASRNNQMLSTSLQGLLPGVTLSRTNGAPGAAGTIKVRGITTIGNSDPLVLIDGVPGGGLNDVNPNDVESISVLKDAASAAIYGARAAAGVILVTTKRGASDNVNVDYIYEYGIDIPTDNPEYVDVIRFMEMTNELRWNDAGNIGNEYPTYPKQTIEDYWQLNAENPDLYPNTDWQELIMNKYSTHQKHILSISGGFGKVRTKASIAYDDIDGLHVNRSYQRLTVRLNNDIKFNKWISASADLNFRHNRTVNPVSSPINSMRLAPAVYPAVWQDGRIAEGKSGENPYAAMLYGGNKQDWYNRVSGKIALDITPLEGLKITAIVAPTYNFDKTKKFTKKIEYYAADSPSTLLGTINGHAATSLYEVRGDSFFNNLQFFANYSKSFGDHNLNLTAGYEENYTFVESLNVSGDNFEISSFPYMDRAPKDALSSGGNAYESALNSLFGRIMYNYKNKYLVQANMRYDGSSRFAKGNRWGFFPSVSAGWVISEEPFFKNNVPTVSFLKLRAAYGVLGNERLKVVNSNGDIMREYYPYISVMTYPTALFYYGDTVKPDITAAQNQYAVRDITWETTKTFDVAVDLALFDNRLQFTADYYRKFTTDMLLNVKIPAYVGFSDPVQNAAKMLTTGYEFEVNWRDHIGDLNYSVSFNLSDSKTKMGYMAGSQFLGEQVKMMRSEYNEWYGYVSEGIFQTYEEVEASPTLNANTQPGDIKYKDISGPDGKPDGIISPEYDRTFLGGSLPRFEYGANISMDWKGIDFQLVLQGIGKQWVRKTTEMVAPLRSDWGNIPAIIDGKYWSNYNSPEQNLAAEYPRLTRANSSSNYAMSDFWLFNGAYLRVKNITIGYSLPESLISKIKLNKVRVYVSLNDFFCFSKFPDGWDPEMASNGYPIMKSVNLGANINF